MIIERQDQEIVIKATSGINMMAVQKVIDYINVLEITYQNGGTEEQAAELAREVDSKWWSENKHRFIP
jgi:hypothetical protein